MAFQNNFGSLPARAMFEVTNMLFKSSRTKGTGVTEECDQSLPHEVFLPDPKIMLDFSRLKQYQPDEINMNGIKKAGCDQHLYNRMMDVVRNCDNNAVKIHFLNDFYERITRQHISSVLNKELRSSHALHQIKYIEQCKATVCDDLRRLVNEKQPAFFDICEDLSEDHPLYHRDHSHSKLRDQVLEDKHCPGYWRLHAETVFLSNSFLMDQLLMQHNEQFFFLTPQNLHICNSVWVSCIMYRLGQHDDFTYMGMPVVICDTAAKLRMSPGANFGAQSSEVKDGSQVCTKIPSAGLDLIREILDSRRTSYQQYIKGHVIVEDAQKLTQLKRFTEGGLQVGFVMFINNKIERIPESELAADCVMPEGPPERFETMNALLMAIPRDGDHNSEMWTTVDRDRTNIRDKARLKLIQGFSLYIVLMGKNYAYEPKIESRWRDTLIVCTIMYSSGQLDLEGMLYLSLRDGANQGPVEVLENKMDSEVSRKGVVRNNRSQKTRSKVCTFGILHPCTSWFCSSRYLNNFFLSLGFCHLAFFVTWILSLGFAT
jgi:hypothetical protein